ncbi:MAG TPA: SUMF1/EgtB/PvdO family nonheme iron enzyme [Planctomycetota bacterium]|nr:SUMF1/EgtB/PvdO family nonheme iron enzyme [Planctomycetota bacterium]
MFDSAVRGGMIAALLAFFIMTVAPRACSQDAPADPAPKEPQGAPEAPEPKPEPNAQEPAKPKEEPKAPAEEGAALAGFLRVPAGQVWPGCTEKEYKERHLGNSDLKKELIYDVWGKLPPFPLPAFQIGKFEVTNAQWKQYMDQEFRVEHTTGKGETLRSLAGQYVKFRGESVESEWMAIYALNWKVLVEGWQKMKVKKDESDPGTPVWQNWPIEAPPSTPPSDVGSLPLPEGIKLFIYRTRVPQHWYGWCRLSGFSVGREYCDPSKPAAEAFKVPDEEFLKNLSLADTDFAAYPLRSASPNEILAFAEWTGCELPSEYEWERAARGDKLRWPYPFGPWDHDKQKTLIAGADNEKCRMSGPMRVDDPSVSASDSPFGARHMSGNVWELTRTFFDVHPDQVIAPPSPADRANYTLVAKGGSFGDRWQMLMVCARAGIIGVNGQLSLRENNRVDSLGLRLVRHDRPGYDLMLHAIRHLTYDAAAGDWSVYVPHAFAMERAAGTDDAKSEDVGAPYVHFARRATGVGFAPLWVTKLDTAATRAKPARNEYYVLGAFRSDVPLKVGLRLSDAEARKLAQERESYDKLAAAWKKLAPAKQKNVPKPDPPPNYEADAYETATEKNAAQCGLYREGTLAPGEWLVAYWNGYIGLVNRNLTMPPEAIVIVDPKQIARKSAQPAPATLKLGNGAVNLHFQVWEQPTDKNKQIKPPDTSDTTVWALWEALPSFFIKGAASARPYCWDVEVAFPIASTDDPAWKALVPDATTGQVGEKKFNDRADAAKETSPGK